MSLEVSNFYWERCPGVKGSERLVILALANYCNEWGWCFPSVPELSRRCQLSDRGTQKVLARLAAGGHIAVEANEGLRKTRGSPTHKYHLLAYQQSRAGARGELAGSPLAVEKGEHTRSPIAVDKGEQIDGKGEPARSPEPYRSIKDPNTTADAAAAATSLAPTDYQKVVAAYHNAIGTLTPIVEGEINAELAAEAAGRRAAYLQKIDGMQEHERAIQLEGFIQTRHNREADALAWLLGQWSASSGSSTSAGAACQSCSPSALLMGAVPSGCRRACRMWWRAGCVTAGRGGFTWAAWTCARCGLGAHARLPHLCYNAGARFESCKHRVTQRVTMPWA